jgi:replicative DNA helicase
MSPNECIPLCVEKGVVGEVFYDLRGREVMETMVAMHDQLQPVDLITLQQWLKDNGVLEQVGGIAFLNECQDLVPSAANLPTYIEEVLNKATLRRYIHLCTDVVGRIYDYEGDVALLADEIEHDLLEIRPKESSEIVPMPELVGRAITRIEDIHNRKGAISGLPTGFADLDRMTDGLHPSHMITIAARPSMGKTSIALNVAENLVLNHNIPVGIFSLEMTAEELVTRCMCSCARVNLRNISEGFMSESDFPKLTSVAGRLSKASLYIDDSGSLSIMQLRARARRMVQKHKIKLLVVDYLQLLHSTTKRARENRQQEISDISGGLKALAKELKIPVLVLSQLNRELEKDKNRKPRLADIRESGSVEQDSDVVGMLYKPKTDAAEDEYGQEADGMPVNLLIAKQRNGPTGEVNLTFLKPYTRFESAARVSDDDVPVDK